MLNRYFLLITFIPLLGSIAWFSSRLDSSIQSEHEVRRQNWRTDQAHRRELLEFLDLVVTEQRYYRSLNGKFARDFTSLEMSPPEQIATSYEVHFQEASKDRLNVLAIAREGAEQVSIDENFEISANFSLPRPTLEYLKGHAQNHLRALLDAPAGRLPQESGVFRGYFQFELARDSRSAYGIGVRPPVLGTRVELGQGGSREKAQVERAPALWPELTNIIRLEAVAAERSESGQSPEIPVERAGPERKPASLQAGQAGRAAGESGLEIEPILPDE